MIHLLWLLFILENDAALLLSVIAQYYRLRDFRE